MLRNKVAATGTWRNEAPRSRPTGKFVHQIRVGETKWTDDDIAFWIRLWVRDHPQYDVLARGSKCNCQDFVQDFCLFLTEGKRGAPRLRQAYAGRFPRSVGIALGSGLSWAKAASSRNPVTGAVMWGIASVASAEVRDDLEKIRDRFREYKYKDEMEARRRLLSRQHSLRGPWCLRSASGLKHEHQYNVNGSSNKLQAWCKVHGIEAGQLREAKPPEKDGLWFGDGPNATITIIVQKDFAFDVTSNQQLTAHQMKKIICFLCVSQCRRDIWWGIQGTVELKSGALQDELENGRGHIWHIPYCEPESERKVLELTDPIWDR